MQEWVKEIHFRRSKRSGPTAARALGDDWSGPSGAEAPARAGVFVPGAAPVLTA